MKPPQMIPHMWYHLSHARVLQSRSQSPRYPCPAERENEWLWDKAFFDNRILVIPVTLRRRERVVQDGV